MDQVTNNESQIYEIFNKIINILSGVFAVAKNPTLTLIAVAATLIGGGLLYYFVKRWIKKKAIEAAEKDSQKDFQDIIEDKIPENKDNNIKDNENRKELDKLQ